MTTSTSSLSPTKLSTKASIIKELEFSNLTPFDKLYSTYKKIKSDQNVSNISKHDINQLKHFLSETSIPNKYYSLNNKELLQRIKASLDTLSPLEFKILIIYIECVTCVLDDKCTTSQEVLTKLHSLIRTHPKKVAKVVKMFELPSLFDDYRKRHFYEILKHLFARASFRYPSVFDGPIVVRLLKYYSSLTQSEKLTILSILQEHNFPTKVINLLGKYSNSTQPFTLQQQMDVLDDFSQHKLSPMIRASTSTKTTKTMKANIQPPPPSKMKLLRLYLKMKALWDAYRKRDSEYIEIDQLIKEYWNWKSHEKKQSIYDYIKEYYPWLHPDQKQFIQKGLLSRSPKNTA